jgi:hypothetical protein
VLAYPAFRPRVCVCVCVCCADLSSKDGGGLAMSADGARIAIGFTQAARNSPDRPSYNYNCYKYEYSYDEEPKEVHLRETATESLDGGKHPELGLREARADHANWDCSTGDGPGVVRFYSWNAEASDDDDQINNWRFTLHTTGADSDCPEGQRNAQQSECLEAVKTAASAAGVQVLDRLKEVDDALYVPPGCSWSPNSMAAVFNRNKLGGTPGDYRLVCKPHDRHEIERLRNDMCACCVES